MSTDYLLGLTETKNHPYTELHELGLSDEMIDVLKSGKINKRLLCELATHPGFRRFLVDMEIFVDRIADMRVHDMNAMLDAARRMAKFAPHLRTVMISAKDMVCPIRKEMKKG